MHVYKLLKTPEELNQHLLPILKANGSEIPPEGCYVAEVEFDEQGEVVAYQMIQNALFLEGFWSRDNTSHLRNLHNRAIKTAEELGAKRVMTLLSTETEAGKRLAQLAPLFKFELMKWNVFRRKL
jgi:hypothetical protein